MKISEDLKNAILKKDIAYIRGELWSLIIIDPSLKSEFKKTLEYILNNGITEKELYEKDDNCEYETEPTMDNFSKLGGKIRVNFSEKKLKDLKRIGKNLYPSKENKKSKKHTYISLVAGACTGAIIGKVAIGGTIAIIGGGILGAATVAVVKKIIKK